MSGDPACTCRCSCYKHVNRPAGQHRGWCAAFRFAATNGAAAVSGDDGLMSQANRMLSREARLEDLETVARLLAEVAALRAKAAAADRVRELHVPLDRGTGPRCQGCSTHVTFTPWPCATIRALDGPPTC